MRSRKHRSQKKDALDEVVSRARQKVASRHTYRYCFGFEPSFPCRYNPPFTAGSSRSVQLLRRRSRRRLERQARARHRCRRHPPRSRAERRALLDPQLPRAPRAPRRLAAPCDRVSLVGDGWIFSTRGSVARKRPARPEFAAACARAHEVGIVFYDRETACVF